MSSLFRKPKAVKAPPPPAPVPTADAEGLDLDAMGLMRKARRGYSKTLLAGNTSPMGTQSRTLLG